MTITTIRPVQDPHGVSEVDHPKYYQSVGGVECIDVAEHLSFNRGNALKYLWRAGRKSSADEIEDLQKSIWYIAREIERLQRSQEAQTHD